MGHRDICSFTIRIVFYEKGKYQIVNRRGRLVYAKINHNKEEKMNTYRKTAISVGALYIIGTVSGILSVIVTGTTLDAPISPAQISANANQLTCGALLVLTMGLALAMIPAAMFPILRKHHECLAVGYVVFRGALETFTYMAMAITWLVLIILSEESVRAGAPAVSSYQVLGTIVLGAHDAIRSILEIVFPLGALMFYCVLYQFKLIPQWLSGWGLAAASLWLAVGLLGVFHLIAPMSAIQDALSVPIGLQEMVMAVWLIAKGFNATASSSESVIPNNWRTAR